MLAFRSTWTSYSSLTNLLLRVPTAYIFKYFLLHPIPNVSAAPSLSLDNSPSSLAHESRMTSVKFISKYFYIHFPSPLCLWIQRTISSF